MGCDAEMSEPTPESAAAAENQETSQAPRTEGGSTNSAPEGSNPPPFQGGGWNPWVFNPAMGGMVPGLGGAGGGERANGIAMPPWVPNLQIPTMPGFSPLILPEQGGQPGAFVVVQLVPIYGPLGDSTSSNSLPATFTMPLGAPMTVEGFMPPAGAAADGVGRPDRVPRADERVPAGLDGLRQRHAAGLAPVWGGAVQRPELQRQIVRRFRVGFQLDLLLLLKLAVVVFVFNQDGSKDRLFLLLFLAGVVYLYQTGALTPLLRWISQSAQQAMRPPQQPNVAGQGGQPEQPRDGVAGDRAADADPAVRAAAGEAGGGAGGVANPPLVPEVDGDRRAPLPQGNWWGFFKEVQMLVVGFVTSLLPGFQHAD